MERDEIVARWLERAHESIEEARLLLAHDHSSAAVNRLYYAAFYAATAYLTKYDRSAKTHKGARLAFGVLIVERGAVTLEEAEVYHALFQDRHRADYGYFTDMDAQMVQTLVEPTMVFITAIERAISSQ